MSFLSFSVLNSVRLAQPDFCSICWLLGHLSFGTGAHHVTECKNSTQQEKTNNVSAAMLNLSHYTFL